MVNLEKVQLSRRENASDSLEVLGLLDHEEDEYLSTQCECEIDSTVLNCHSRKDSRRTRHKTQAKRKLIITSLVCLIFMIGEVIGGYAAHSLAIMTDAAHLLTDLCSILLSLFSLWISSRPSTKRLTFGWHRSEEHRNTSVRAAFIHTLGDLLQSFGVLMAATIIYFQPEWKIADPVCTFLFSLFVLGTTFTILKDIFHTLMEGVPPGVDINSIKDLLLSVGGVKSTHDLHVWSLTSSETQLSVHAVIDEQTDPQTVLMDMTKLLRSKYGFDNITIQTETYRDDRSYCSQCHDLKD
ncbi:probable proton-coupled zinc antiporter SLC30A3 isoform X2 [Triplophysa dalaica]|uniref:probable proton-coupled zinc antiporter SLC30A3 isoform X2 n=1 Tax=Triplophysa dalaica TaxID=1582913 RepID=UPI0024DFF308|nr:probable proton-coupled zinc antiporter SLC30A3 isoform X2 [Triplophysa dalaica]